MAIPATDRRSDRRPQPEPREHRANGANGKTPRPQHHGHNGKQHDGKPDERRSDQPQARGSHPPQQQPRGERHEPRGERTAPAHDGIFTFIAAIAFMQPKKSGARRHAGGQFGQRAPR